MQKLCCVCTRQQFSASLVYLVTSLPPYLHQFSTIFGGNRTSKPWLFGNEYHMVCCCTSGIMWGIDLEEGKDHPRALGQQEFDNMGSTVGLLLRMLVPIFHRGMWSSWTVASVSSRPSSSLGRRAFLRAA